MKRKKRLINHKLVVSVVLFVGKCKPRVRDNGASIRCHGRLCRRLWNCCHYPAESASPLSQSSIPISTLM